MDRRKFLRNAIISATALGTTDLARAGMSRLAASTNTKTQQAVMPQRELGKTGVKIPILQLGTAQRMNPVYDKVMHLCLREGVTCFDTALAYGRGASHHAIANFLEQTEARKNLWITSKSGSRRPKGLIRDIDKALAQLKTDYLDLYLMHGIKSTDMLHKDYLMVGEQLRRSDKIRFFGFSCHDGNVVELMQAAAQVGGLDAILFRYNFRRYGDRELNLAIDNCKQAGIGLLAMKTMGSVPPNIEEVVQFRSRDFTLAQAKLKSVWADERIDSLVSEMDSVRVARENIAAAKSERSLTAEDSHQLNRLAALTANYACNGCSHLCESAITDNIAIAEQLRYLMYYECYGKKEHARQLYQSIPLRFRSFNDDQLKKASTVCPQGIDIAARLNLARNVLET